MPTLPGFADALPSHLPLLNTTAFLVTAGKGVCFLAWGGGSLARYEHYPTTLHATLGLGEWVALSSPSMTRPPHGMADVCKSKLNR